MDELLGHLDRASRAVYAASNTCEYATLGTMADDLCELYQWLLGLSSDVAMKKYHKRRAPLSTRVRSAH